MSQSFSEELRTDALQIWDRIFSHPFLLEIQSGALDLNTFRYYVIQDYHYLEGFGRAVSIALSKSPDSNALQTLAKRINTPVERPLHRRLFELVGLTIEDAMLIEPSPTNRAYMDHMITTASTGGVGEAAAALLPCPWTYHEIGSKLSVPDKPPFNFWVESYSTGLLEESTAAWRALVDKFGAEGGPLLRSAMKRAFLTSSRYEYMFWTMAYDVQKWPV